jgi:hypothetical protein
LPTKSVFDPAFSDVTGVTGVFGCKTKKIFKRHAHTIKQKSENQKQNDELQF